MEKYGARMGHCLTEIDIQAINLEGEIEKLQRYPADMQIYQKKEEYKELLITVNQHLAENRVKYAEARKNYNDVVMSQQLEWVYVGCKYCQKAK